jgi:hypothetical protein
VEGGGGKDYDCMPWRLDESVAKAIGAETVKNFVLHRHMPCRKAAEPLNRESNFEIVVPRIGLINASQMERTVTFSNDFNEWILCSNLRLMQGGKISFKGRAPITK